MRPHVDAVALLTLDPLDPFGRHEREQPVLSGSFDWPAPA